MQWDRTAAASLWPSTWARGRGLLQLADEVAQGELGDGKGEHGFEAGCRQCDRQLDCEAQALLRATFTS